MPPEFSALLTAFLSLAALRDWFKLAIIGGFIETCRRLYSTSWTGFLDKFWVVASFDDDDTSYNWILFWLSKHPTWSKARRIEVTTRDFDLNSDLMEDDDEDRQMTYIPSLSSKYSLWYKGHYMTVSRSEVQNGTWRTKERVEICILSRDTSILSDLVLEAKTYYKAAKDHLIAIHVSDPSNNWRRVASRPKRPLKSIILDPGIKDLLLNDAEDFLQSRDWYSDRGIPFRRGYLLYGAPGSGKTSIIQSLAGELGLDVFIISLSRSGLDDSSLSELISELPKRCIALMEDIDAAFHQGVRRDRELDATPDSGKSEKQEHDKERDSPLSRVTLSGLLNALDGIGAQEGRILFATTNDYHALDPALCRPGRMDLHIEFKLASKLQAEELYKCFYMPSGPAAEDAKAQSDTSGDSGYASPASSAAKDLADAGPPSPTGSTDSTTLSSSDAEKQSLLYTGSLSSFRAPLLPRKKVHELAARFAETIPERELSMASLQGYLMTYKIRPYEAVDGALAWVVKQLEEKEKAKSARGRSGLRPDDVTPDNDD
ncbi:P-loop containing nucleoside triphosphate hydrolase protein [Sparassis latifolia]